MNDKQLFLDCIDFATSIVELVAPADMENSTPDSDWTVRQLLEHMLTELAWTSDIVAGKTLEEVDGKYEGDLIGNDLQRSWRSTYEDAVESVDATGVITVHVSYGDIPLNKYLQQAAADQLIHSWDLGEGIGVTIEFPDDVVEAILENTNPQELASSGLFDEPVKVPSSASPQTRLLAMYGRSE